jgi:hypothetical protein
MTFEEKKERLAEVNPEALLADGFEDALIGYVQQFNKTVALYDYDKCVAILMFRDKMSDEDAREFLEFNTLGAYVGENTPAFAFLFQEDAPHEQPQTYTS